MTTLYNLRDQAEDFNRHKMDYTCTPVFNERAQLVPIARDTGFGTDEYKMSDWAIQQLCTKLGPGSFGRGVGKMLPKDAIIRWISEPEFQPHIANILNENVRRVDSYGSTWLVRTYADQVRAILSERYAPVSNSEVLDKAIEAVDLLGRQYGRTLDITLVREQNTPDDLRLKVIVRNLDVLVPGEHNPYGIGFFISNNETGRGGLRSAPVLQRHSCTNSIVFMHDDDVSLNVRHRGVPELLVNRLALSFGNALKLSAEYLEDLIALKDVELPDIFGQISKLAEKKGWSTGFTDAVRTGTEGTQTIFGLVNGLTFAAHSIFHDDQEQMLTWEALAGQIVHQPQTTLAQLGITVPAYVPLDVAA